MGYFVAFYNKERAPLRKQWEIKNSSWFVFDLILTLLHWSPALSILWDLPDSQNKEPSLRLRLYLRQTENSFCSRMSIWLKLSWKVFFWTRESCFCLLSGKWSHLRLCPIISIFLINPHSSPIPILLFPIPKGIRLSKRPDWLHQQISQKDSDVVLKFWYQKLCTQESFCTAMLGRKTLCSCVGSVQSLECVI